MVSKIFDKTFEHENLQINLGAQCTYPTGKELKRIMEGSKRGKKLLEDFEEEIKKKLKKTNEKKRF